MTQKILCIEDNVDNLLLLDRSLSVRGYEVIWASDGESGLREAHDNPPDLVLLDINLPDIDGYEVARRLRMINGFGRVPIIALTANALKGDADKAITAGCDGYMAKPFEIRELWNQVDRALGVVEQAIERA